MGTPTNRGLQASPAVGAGAYLATDSSATSPRAFPINASLIEMEASTATAQNWVFGTGWMDGHRVCVAPFGTGAFNISPASLATGSLSTATSHYVMDATGEIIEFAVYRDTFIIAANSGVTTATVAAFSTAT